MKKVMFVLVSLLIVSTFAFALESGPSNKVGYVKIQVNGGTSAVYTAFGLPFKFWFVPSGNIPTYGTESRKPSSIVGSQAACGSASGADRIVRQDGEFAFRLSPACNWSGALETNPADMEPGRAYWYRNNTGSNRNLVLAGEADTTAGGIPTFTIFAPAPNGTQSQPYSWRDPRDVAVNRLNLLAQGFTGGSVSTSDKVLTQGGAGTFAYYNTTTNAWAGTLSSVTPGTAYWIQNKHTGHPWNYTYNASGVPIIIPGGGPAVIQKVSAPVVVPVHRATKTANQ